jgi:hypothetical protein
MVPQETVNCNITVTIKLAIDSVSVLPDDMQYSSQDLETALTLNIIRKKSDMHR